MFALVGAQMSWVLRPFIGSRGTPFQWFRPRGSNFFEAVYHTFIGLFSEKSRCVEAANLPSSHNEKPP